MYTNPKIQRSRKIISTLVILTLLLGAIVFPTSPAHATTNIIVNTNADNATANDGFCTLREAIINVNEGLDTTSGDCATGAGATTITFAANYTITLTSALPDISTTVTIDGKGAANTIVQASTCDPVNLPGGCAPADWRVFTFTAGSSTLKDMTVRYGNCDNSNFCSTVDNNKGGNIYTNTVALTLDAVNVQSGYSYGDGGGIYSINSNLTIQNNSLIGGSGTGNKADTGNASYAGGVFFKKGGTLLIDNSEVSYNAAGSYGGGIHAQNGTFTIQNGSLIDHNTSEGDNGGGMNAEGAGCTLTVDASTISNNLEKAGDGGGLWTNCETTINASTISGNTVEDSQGGGVYIFGNATIANSTIAGNQTTYVNSTGQDGGGIYNNGTLTVVNSTFYNNTAYNYGGGIYNKNGKSATLINSTISDGDGDYANGIYNAGTLHLSNNIIANSYSSFDCVNNGGTIATDIKNLIESNNGCGTPASSLDPKLGPLVNYGGPTQTMALLIGSPAIDAGDDTVCADVNTVNNLDQRGVTRPVSDHCDIGAYEFTQTFTDVPMNYWAWQYIERLYNAGITGGCTVSPLNYCPGNQVTRAQMAVFLEKGLHYPLAYAAPNVAPTFTDTVGHWAEDWIEALKSDGVTSGCGVGIYCPENPVTRAQMAVFLLKAKHGSSYVPPAATGVFSDVSVGYWADKWIEQLAADGITSGCGTGIYCPDAPVTRAQMAVFLVKTFGLP